MARLGAAVVILLLGLGTAAAAYDKYADAMAKYEMWHKKHGGAVQIRRDPRRTASKRIGRPNSIFVPHRPAQQGGRQFQPSDLSLHTDTGLLGIRGVTRGPSLFRGTRGNVLSSQVGLGGSEYVSQHGTPIYKLRKQNPLYGRRRRRETREERQGWALLDPSTGRPLKQAADRTESAAGLRLTRNPAEPRPQTIADYYSFPPASGTEYLRADGTPLYKRYKSSPYGGGRRKREVERILHRVPRSWALLDPNTGRPVKPQEPEFPPSLRRARQPGPGHGAGARGARGARTWTNSAGVIQPIYKYYKKYPFGYSG